MARSREAARLPSDRSCHTTLALPRPLIDLSIPLLPGDLSNELITPIQLEGLPQIPQKHLVGKPDRHTPHGKTQNASGQRLLKRAETLFAIAQELANSEVCDRALHRKKLEDILKADGHTLFEYHATFVLRTEMESMSSQREWTSQMIMLWNSLSEESRGWWRTHTEQILRAMEDELDLAVPRNFQTGDVTTVARAYAYRVKAAMHRQKVGIPEQQPGQMLIEVPRIQRLRPRPTQDVRIVIDTTPRGHCPAGAHGRVHRKSFSASKQDGHHPSSIIKFLSSRVAPFEASSVDVLREKLLQAISGVLKEDPSLQIYCRAAGVRIIYKPGFFGVAGIAARLRTAAQQAEEEGCGPYLSFNTLLRPFAYCNLSAPVFWSVNSRSSPEHGTYIPENDASCLSWLGGKIDGLARRKKKEDVVRTLMVALRHHITRIVSFFPLASMRCLG